MIRGAPRVRNFSRVLREMPLSVICPAAEDRVRRYSMQSARRFGHLVRCLVAGQTSGCDELAYHSSESG
jgi:hypothetical protein